MKTNISIAMITILFFTFGITYLDFENLSFSDNIRPYTLLTLGIIAFIYLIIRKNTFIGRIFNRKFEHEEKHH